MTKFYVRMTYSAGTNRYQLSLREGDGPFPEPVDVGEPIESFADAKAIAEWLQEALPEIQKVVIEAETR